MEEEWRRYLRENAPHLYEEMLASLQHQSEWRDRLIDRLRTVLKVYELGLFPTQMENGKWTIQVQQNGVCCESPVGKTYYQLTEKEFETPEDALLMTAAVLAENGVTSMGVLLHPVITASIQGLACTLDLHGKCPKGDLVAPPVRTSENAIPQPVWCGSCSNPTCSLAHENCYASCSEMNHG